MCEIATVFSIPLSTAPLLPAHAMRVRVAAIGWLRFLASNFKINDDLEMKECVNDALVCTEQAFHYLNSLSSMLKLEAGKVRSSAAWRRTWAQRYSPDTQHRRACEAICAGNHANAFRRVSLRPMQACAKLRGMDAPSHTCTRASEAHVGLRGGSSRGAGRRVEGRRSAGSRGQYLYWLV
eukprot:3774070-Pleurochrysis_carterae.AAC.4